MSEPDWENFAKAVLTDWPTGDLDGSVLFDLSLQYGMIQEVPGGYNSDHHIDAEGICPEEGDPWYEYTFRGEAGPGLYSINDMTATNEQLSNCVAVLEADLRKMTLDYLAAQGQASENFQMYVDANEARIDAEAKMSKAVEALEGWVNVYTHCFIEEGVCCCGEDMNNHTSHMPMDHGAYIAAQLGQFTTTTLAELKGEK